MSVEGKERVSVGSRRSFWSSQSCVVKGGGGAGGWEEGTRGRVRRSLSPFYHTLLRNGKQTPGYNVAKANGDIIMMQGRREGAGQGPELRCVQAGSRVMGYAERVMAK